MVDGELWFIVVIFMDIDFFKVYNDFYGYGCGDDCICIVVEVIVDVIRFFNGFVVCYGGEEFLILFFDVDKIMVVVCVEFVWVVVEDFLLEYGSSDVLFFVIVSFGIVNGLVIVESF